MRNKRRSQKRGLATVETALVLPLLVLVVFGIIEFGTVFFVRHNMINAARDAARNLSVRDVTAAQARQIALDHLDGIDANFTVNVTEPTSPTSANRDVSVEITVPLSDVSFGIPGLTNSGTIRAEVTMRKEDA